VTAGIFSHVRFFLKCASSPKGHGIWRRDEFLAKDNYVFCVAWLYNGERLHQSLNYKTPEAGYRLTA
jgi:hypothetical protein